MFKVLKKWIFGESYTEKELFQWMWDQPDDRPVDMTNSLIGETCSCLLAQFFSDKGHGSGYATTVGHLVSFDIPHKKVKVKLSKSIFGYFDIFRVYKNFKELKENFQHAEEFGLKN